MIEFDCPECGNPMEVPDGVTGETHTCPNCGAAVEITEDLERDAATEPAGMERRSAYARSQLELAQLPSPKESWLTAIPTFVSSAVLFVIMYFGGLALHIWTSALFWDRWGPFWGLIAFFTPFFSEAVAVFACFWWHVWYYVLAIALWLASMGGMAFVEEGPAFRRRSALFIGWVFLVGVLSVGFGHYAWRYSLGPTSRTATDQAQLEDCAVAVVVSLRASASNDPRQLASLVTAKKELKDTIQGYEKASLDELCSIVDQFLIFERSMQKDLLAYLSQSHRNGGTLKFKISDETKQALSRLPNKVRTTLQADLMEAGEAEITKKVGENISNLPENWQEVMDKHLASTWKIYG